MQLLRPAILYAACLLFMNGCSARPEPVIGTTSGGIEYEVLGEGDDVVLIPGFSLDRRMWDPQVEALESEFRVVRYDLRGHGGSVLPTEPYQAYTDLRDVLDELDIDRAAIVGLSAGAQIATDFALMHPARVSKLLLASPGLTGYVPQGSFAWMAPVIEAARAGDAELAARAWAETPLMVVDDSSAAAFLRTILVDNARLWSLSINPERPIEPPAIGRLKEISVPVLAMVGERDLVDTHRVVDTLATCISGAQKVVVADVGHMVNLAAPEEFNDAMLTFLRQTDGGGGPTEPAVSASPC